MLHKLLKKYEGKHTIDGPDNPETASQASSLCRDFTQAALSGELPSTVAMNLLYSQPSSVPRWWRNSTLAALQIDVSVA